ncbi:hypothetical protein JL720_13661 [Aureococcus anophagefferens]|nr:hypothetical protein JL720_13661 [Aureococcus anophagefferens]
MALLVAMLSHRVYAAYEPYVDDDDDALSEVAQTQLVLVFFGSLLLFVGEHTDGERGYATDAFGAVLALVMSAGLLVAVYYVLVDALGRDRVEREERLLLEKAEGLIHHLAPTSPKRHVAFAADEKKEIELADVYGGSSSSDDDASSFAAAPSYEAATTPRATAEEKRPEEAKREATSPSATPKENTPRRGRSFRAKAIAAHRAKKAAAAPAPRRRGRPGHEPCGHLRRAPVARGGERSDLE